MSTEKNTESTTEGEKWDVNFSSNVAKWNELSGGQKALYLLGVLFKICVIVFSLYAFICSLSWLADGFRLVAGRQAGQIFRNSEVFNNPIAGMLVGILVTVLVQSSSTSTSIIITMVAADLFTVKQAINLVMGANIGTSVTSTIVALGQVGNRDEFRRAFAAATVHDMFNFLTCAIFLPIEAATGYLFHLSGALLPEGLKSASKPPDILKALTKPFTKMISSVDKKVITKIAAAETQAELDALADKPMLKHLFGVEPPDMSDGAAGAILLVGSLTVLCITLALIVFTLKSLLKGRIAVWLHKSVNGNVPDIKCGGITIPMGWVAGYISLAAGLGITICVQSSSITTSALTPLVGVGVISVDRMYPVVLGANIGTTVTGVLAALAASSSKLELTLRVAFAHLMFNISGIALFYVVWPLRALPLGAAKFLGNVTAKYRWFALAYLFVCFFLVPLIIMGLSLASAALAAIVIGICIFLGVVVAIVNTMQSRCPNYLPAKLQNWEFLPECMRSLAPMDRAICGPLGKMCGCCMKASAVGASKETPATSSA